MRQPVVVIEIHSDAVGSRAYQRPPSVTERTRTSEGGLGHHDATDDQCTRGADAMASTRRGSPRRPPL